MNRIINDPDAVAEEALAGIVAAHADLLTTTSHPRVIRAARGPKDRVGIVTGGGKALAGVESTARSAL